MTNFLKALWRALRVPSTLVVLVVGGLVIADAIRLRDFGDILIATEPAHAAALVIAWSGWIHATRRQRIAFTAAIGIGGLLIFGALALDEYGGWRSSEVELPLLLGFAISIVTALALIYFSRPRGEDDKPRELNEVERFHAELTPLPGQVAGRIAEHMIRESERMRRLSFLTLGGVAALMTVTVLVVLFAGLITTLDLSGADPVLKARFLESNARDDLDRARSKYWELVAERKDLKIALPNAPERGSTRSPNDSTSVQTRLDALDQLIPDKIEDRKRLKTRYDAVATILTTAESTDILTTGTTQAQTTEALIASAVTRFGVIVVLMFLAQALINLYRYALRLSAFYRSRAFMMVLTDGDPSKLQEAAKTLSADHVSLGKEPKSPINEVTKILAAAAKLKG